jgi:hypothetical protein
VRLAEVDTPVQSKAQVKSRFVNISIFKKAGFIEMKLLHNDNV